MSPSRNRKLYKHYTVLQEERRNGTVDDPEEVNQSLQVSRKTQMLCQLQQN